MPPRKRPQAHSTTPASTSSRRKSGRLSAGSKKSSYFEDDESADGGSPVPSRPRKMARMKGPAKKAREDESSEDVLQRESVSDAYDDEEDDDGDSVYYDAEAQVSEDEEEQEDEDEEEEDDDSTPQPPKKRARGRPSTSAAAKATPKASAKARGRGTAKARPQESEPEDEYDDEDDEDGPRVTFIPLPQLRDTDGVEYVDTRLHKNTLLFLKDLKANNKRSWLKMNDAEYRRSLKDWESFVEAVTEKIADADETIPELPLKDVIFRIYRDIRFTKDPTPYKPHFSAAWSRTGRKGPYACYYVHAEPGNCLVGGGLWHPDAESLGRLRASIDERPHRIRRVLADPAFRRTFLPDAAAAAAAAGRKDKKKSSKGGKGKEGEDEEERAVVNAFARANQEGALKTKPKGFHPDHRDIELLKLRNFTISKKIRDEDLLGKDAREKIMGIIEPMVPFITFLNRIVRPDPGEDSDSEAEDDEDEE